MRSVFIINNLLSREKREYFPSKKIEIIIHSVIFPTCSKLCCGNCEQTRFIPCQGCIAMLRACDKSYFLKLRKIGMNLLIPIKQVFQILVNYINGETKFLPFYGTLM